MEAGPVLDKGIQTDLGTDFGDGQNLALLSRFDGIGEDAVDFDPAHLGELGDHRLDDTCAHFGGLLDDVVEARGLERGEAEPEIGARRLLGGLFDELQPDGLLVGVGDAGQPGAVEAIEQDDLVAGVQLAISQPIKIGDRISFEDIEGRVIDITLGYTYVDPGDASAVVIPNQLLVEGVVHNHSVGDTQA